MSPLASSAARLRPPTMADVEAIAGWHPIAIDEVVTWWNTEDVEPWAMTDAGGSLIGYGEIWVDAEEDEVELARLIIPEPLRGRGLGKQLVHLLLPIAAAKGMTTTFLRVMPDNEVAIRCYLACGFYRLGPEESAVWNEGQRREWVWMLLGSAADN